MRKFEIEYNYAQEMSALYLIMDKIVKIGFESDDYREAIKNGYNKNYIQDLNYLEHFKNSIIEHKYDLIANDLSKDDLENAIAEWKSSTKDPIAILGYLSTEERQRFANDVSYLALACRYIKAKTNRRDFLLKYELLPSRDINRRALMSDEILLTDEICTNCTTTLQDDYLDNRRKFKAVKISQSITLKSIWGTLLNGSFEKQAFIDEINKQFYNLYVSGKLKRLYKAGTTIGRESDRHDMSSKIWNGLELKVKNDSLLTVREIEQFSKDFLEDKELVRQLLSLGYSTLIITGTKVNITNEYKLTDFG